MIDLSSEQAFGESLKSLSCNGCKFFVNKVCREKDSKLHMVDKSFLQQDALNRWLQNHDEFSKEWGENIDNYFLCEAYESIDGKLKIK